jgi:hypothetical protein
VAPWKQEMVKYRQKTRTFLAARDTRRSRLHVIRTTPEGDEKEDDEVDPEGLTSGLRGGVEQNQGRSGVGRLPGNMYQSIYIGFLSEKFNRSFIVHFP